MLKANFLFAISSAARSAADWCGSNVGESRQLRQGGF
jgi:hypothetical protein